MTLYVKIIAMLVALLALTSGYLYWHHVVYQDGYDTAENKYVAEITAANNATEALRTELIGTRADMATKLDALKTKYDADVAAAAQQTKLVTQTVTKVIHDNPTFAVVKRPDPLARVRYDQLEAVRRAANGQGGQSPPPTQGRSSPVPPANG